MSGGVYCPECTSQLQAHGRIIHCRACGAEMLGEGGRRVEVGPTRIARILRALRRGDCFCEMAIGNPMVREHSAACVDATTLLSALREER